MAKKSIADKQAAVIWTEKEIKSQKPLRFNAKAVWQNILLVVVVRKHTGFFQPFKAL
ncbi:MAG: hypothetical protein GXW96_06570 [Christensenellaceae bacterium]|nr:hypothetical protein [Christensenellaceae bacterium]